MWGRNRDSKFLHLKWKEQIFIKLVLKKQGIYCLFVYSLPEQFFSYPAAVAITGDGAANLDLCLALMAFSSEGSFSCHTYCDTGPRFMLSHPKGRHPRPTVGFELGTQGSSDLCASALTTALHRRQGYIEIQGTNLFFFNITEVQNKWSRKCWPYWKLWLIDWLIIYCFPPNSTIFQLSVVSSFY